MLLTILKFRYKNDVTVEIDQTFMYEFSTL